MVGCRGEIEGSGSILIDESQALPRSCHDGEVHLKQGRTEQPFFSREKKKKNFSTRQILVQEQKRDQKCLNENLTDHDEFAKTFPEGPTGMVFCRERCELA